VVRLNTPVLRLAYSDSGDAIGVDLLSGERVLAKRWIVSNLTVWDTFGKLIGINKTPPFIKSNLNQTQGNGAYVIYAAVDSSVLPRLPAHNFLVAPIEAQEDENLSGELAVTIQKNSGGLSTATIKTGTQVAPWFSFQASEEDYEEWDQTALEKVWSQLHACVPEFGAGIEVIETANPRTYYDSTRRKLGMVMGTEAVPGHQELLSQTTIPFTNVFMVGDTTSAVAQVSSVTAAAIALAEELV
jgi:phytoene dehydrogenase-like protein